MTVLVAVSITQTLRDAICDVGEGAVGCDRDTVRGNADRHGCSDGIGSGVDHRDVAGAVICDVGVCAVGRDRDTDGVLPTGTVAVTVLVAVSITETLLDVDSRRRRRRRRA